MTDIEVLTGVSGTLSCAHQPVNQDVFGGEVHGHSYLVKAWFPEGGDCRVHKAALHQMLQQWDHKMLPLELSTGEALARAVLVLAGCVKVEIERPLEGFYAMAQRVKQ
jgi:hypothetical protein